MKPTLKTLAAIATFAASPALAEGWTLDNDASRLAFGSIKKNIIGEVHSFESLSGTVNAEGQANISIDLASVETNIDIRNERMAEHVFKFAPSATISAEFEAEEIDALAVGESTVMDIEAVLTLLGVDTEFYTEVFVMRVADDKVMVTTNDMVFLTTEDLEVDQGIDKLKELAELSGITRAAPVTLRFVFTQS